MLHISPIRICVNFTVIYFASCARLLFLGRRVQVATLRHFRRPAVAVQVS